MSENEEELAIKMEELLQKYLNDDMDAKIAFRSMVTQELGSVIKNLNTLTEEVTQLKTDVSDLNNIKLQAKGALFLGKLLAGVGGGSLIIAYIKHIFEK